MRELYDQADVFQAATNNTLVFLLATQPVYQMFNSEWSFFSPSENKEPEVQRQSTQSIMQRKKQKQAAMWWWCLSKGRAHTLLELPQPARPVTVVEQGTPA